MVATETKTETVQYGAPPHGGTLVNLRVEGSEAERLAKEAESLPLRELNSRELSDVEMLTIGGYSPLTGFMTRADYESVVDRMRLANRLPWSIPITLSANSDDVKAGDRLALSVDGRRF